MKAPGLPRASPPASLPTYLATRGAIWILTAFALLILEPLTHVFTGGATPWVHDVGWLVDMWSRWDGGWYAAIAQDGYADPERSTAFFPLYPAAMKVLGTLLGGHPVLAGVLISLAAGIAAVVVLHRLTAELLGEAAANRTVLFLSLYPMSFFLLAVYSESLYLLLSASVFLLARRDRFAAAGVVTGLALLTRSSALALLPAVALLAWRRPEGRWRRLATALLPAAGIGALWPVWLWWRLGDPFLFLEAQTHHSRALSPFGPLGGLGRGLEAAWAGARQLVEPDGRFWAHATDASPQYVAAFNLEQAAYLVAFALLAAVVWRRLGPAFGLFVVVSLALPLSAPTEDYPLLSLPRFGLGAFPLFLALGAVSDDRRLRTPLIWVSAILLGMSIVRWSSGAFVA